MKCPTCKEEMTFIKEYENGEKLYICENNKCAGVRISARKTLPVLKLTRVQECPVCGDKMMVMQGNRGTPTNWIPDGIPTGEYVCTLCDKKYNKEGELIPSDYMIARPEMKPRDYKVIVELPLPNLNATEIAELELLIRAIKTCPITRVYGPDDKVPRRQAPIIKGEKTNIDPNKRLGNSDNEDKRPIITHGTIGPNHRANTIAKQANPKPTEAFKKVMKIFEEANETKISKEIDDLYEKVLLNHTPEERRLNRLRAHNKKMVDENGNSLAGLRYAPGDEGHEGTTLENYCNYFAEQYDENPNITDTQLGTTTAAYMYKLAMGKSNNIQMTNIAYDEKRNINFVAIEEAFKASNNQKPTSKNGIRHKCPECNHEDLKFVNIPAKLRGNDKLEERKAYVIEQLRENYDNLGVFPEERNEISADETGCCPMCGKKLYNKRNAKKAGFEKTTGIYNKGGSEFYNQFDLTHKFWAPASKKADDREPLGVYNPKVEGLRVGVSWTQEPMVKKEATFKTGKLVGLGKVNILKVTTKKPCECGCNVVIREGKRGDVVCPVCGFVHNKVNTYKAGQEDYNTWNGIVSEEEMNVNNEMSMGNENPLLEDD